MNQLLKIVRGPNAGAEVALPEGVAVTLGKGDDCDIVLADATFPDAPLTLEAAADGVKLAGRAAPNAPQGESFLEPFHVVERGATAFATGPADAPWGELVWAAKGESEKSEKSEGSDGSESSESSELSEHSDHSEPPVGKRRRGCLGCLVALLLLLVALGVVAWLLRAQVKPYAERIWPGGARSCATETAQSDADADAPGRVPPARALAQRLNLVADGNKLTGNFATRAERLAAAAEAYAAQPGIELDFSDDESLRTAAEDTLALVGETRLRVAAATNRVVALSGTAANLRRALEALSADLPKLKNVNVAGVTIPSRDAGLLAGEQEKQEMMAFAPSSISPVLLRKNKSTARQSPSLPVCGILTTPYPCLVLRSGQRVMEGAPVGEWTVAKIEADSVTLTNAERSVKWNP